MWIIMYVTAVPINSMMALSFRKSENLFIEVVLVQRNGHLRRVMVIKNELENFAGNEMQTYGVGLVNFRILCSIVN
jgi:hypothetical protein